MRYGPIASELFVENRRRFRELLSARSLAIFNANDISAHQRRRHAGASGKTTTCSTSAAVDQEESILVICPDAALAKHREILFLKETSEHILVWEGYKLTKEQRPSEVSGVPKHHVARCLPGGARRPDERGRIRVPELQ
ncbi:MAG: aminopeptidase P N-terminal domain-containing protein [Hymenobacter sp.]